MANIFTGVDPQEALDEVGEKTDRDYQRYYANNEGRGGRYNEKSSRKKE